MNSQETTKVLMLMQAAYPNFRIQDKEIAIRTWAEMLSDLTYEQVSTALKMFIATDTRGFAPSIGQIRSCVMSTEQTDRLTDSQAWDLVYKALCNSLYHSQEEFNNLPPDVRRAVGGSSTLRAWASMDEEAITVAESNFKRSYRAVLDARERDEVLPPSMRIGMADAPIAAIPEKIEREEVKRASAEKVEELLNAWRSKFNEV